MKNIIYLIILLIGLGNCNKIRNLNLDSTLKGNEKILEVFHGDENIQMINLFNYLGVPKELFIFLLGSKHISREEALNIINFKEKINTLDEEGFNIFHYAILYSTSEKLITLLISLGADVNLPSKDGKFPIFLLLDFPQNVSDPSKFISLQGFRTEVLKILLSYEVDLNKKYKNLNFEGYLKRLVQINTSILRVDSNKVDKNISFYTVLLNILNIGEESISLGNSEPLIEKLKKNILISKNIEEFKETISKLSKEEIVNLTFDGYNLIELCTIYDYTKAVILLVKYFDLNKIGKKMQITLLNSAVTKLNEEIVKILLENGADPRIQDNSGEDPLFKLCNTAAIKEEKNWKTFTRIFEMLVEKGADINAREGEYKLSPLCIAIMNNHYKLVEFLLGKKADVNNKVKFIKGKSNKNLEDFTTFWPLSLAFIDSNQETIELLIKNGAYTSLISHSTLWYSINTKPALFKIALKFVEDKLHIPRNNILQHGTVLYDTLKKLEAKPSYAKEYIEIIDILLNKLHEDPNYSNVKDKVSCLEAAVATECSEIVEMMFKAGARITRKEDLQSSLTIALRNDDTQSALLLLERNKNVEEEVFNLAIRKRNFYVVNKILENTSLKFTLQDNSFFNSPLITLLLFPSNIEISKIYERTTINSKEMKKLLTHFAALGEETDNLSYLISKGHNPFERNDKKFSIGYVNLNPRSKNKNRLIEIKKDERAIDIAMKNQNLESFSLIMEAYKEEKLEAQLEEFIRNNYIFGNKTLLLNIQKNYLGVTKIILTYENFHDLWTFINYIDENGDTSLDYASKLEDKVLIDLLKRHNALSGKDILSSQYKEKEEEEEKKKEKEENKEELFNLIEKGKMEEVIKTLERDASQASASNADNITSLVKCIIKEKEDLLNVIIDTLIKTKKIGSVINKVDINNQTPLSYALDSKNIKIIKTLLENRANCNFRYGRKYSYLIDLSLDHSAKSTKIINLLFEYGCRLNIKDIYFIFKNKNKINTTLLKLFESEIKEFEASFGKVIKKENNKKFTSFILLSKSCEKIYKEMPEFTLKKLKEKLLELKEGKNLSGTKDLKSFSIKFGEIRINDDRIFYLKKGEYFIIIDIYLNKHQDSLPQYYYEKVASQAKLYRNLILNEKVEKINDLASLFKF